MTMGLKVLQINLNHCEVAQDILIQSVRELKIDIVIISEQYRNMAIPTWIADSTVKAAIWTCKQVTSQEVTPVPERGFVWAKINGIFYYSCYAPPSLKLDEFKEFLDRLVNDAKFRKPTVISGDFNAWAEEWGSIYTNHKGQALLEAFAVLDVVLLNVGDKPTFRRGESKSIVDLTFASDSLVGDVVNWSVSDHYSYSDHSYITWAFRSDSTDSIVAKRPCVTKWQATKFDDEVFRLLLNDVNICNGGAEAKAEHIKRALVRLCDASMPRKSSGHRHPPVYWWNDSIADLRRECNHARRRYTRSKNSNRSELHQLYSEARNKLKIAIKLSKRQCWVDLCHQVDSDPWGKPYKIVMKKLKGVVSTNIMCPILMQNTVNALFPQQSLRAFQIPHVNEAIPEVTMEELNESCSKLGSNKAPGLDCIPNVALKLAIDAKPELFLDMYNACMMEGVFPQQWKQQRLALIPKGRKPPGDPSSQRPLCMLNSDGKIFERIVVGRLEKSMGNSLSKNQFGFRKERSTIDAVNLVLNIAKNAVKGTRWKGGSMKYCAIITLDIKNAFNTARWNCIFDAICEMNVPNYLVRLVGNYLSNRFVYYDTANGREEYNVTGGVPQGSVLGPLLWNIMYDAILKLPVPDGVELVGFADDVAAVIVGKEIEDIVVAFDETICMIKNWMDKVGLELAAHKTEVLLVSKRKKRESITLKIGEHEITSKPEIRYLGITIDSRLSFKAHIVISCRKAACTNMALSRIMPNTNGPRQNKRKLLASVTQSILLYGAPVWAEATNKVTYTAKMVSAQRISTLRIACAFRTVSSDALNVLSSVVPIDILARERQRVYNRNCRDKGCMRLIRNEERETSLNEWQERWDRSTKGRWTHRLIPHVETWTERQHGDIDYYLCQILSGHGCFRAYLFKFKHDDSPECPSCAGVIEDAEHVCFECPRFDYDRTELQIKMSANLTPGNLVKCMLNSPKEWEAVEIFAVSVMRKLRAIEEVRRCVAVISNDS